MDFLNKIMPVIWQIVEKKKKCAVNVTTIEDKLIVSILLGRRRKVFSHPNDNVLLEQLENFLAA